MLLIECECYDDALRHVPTEANFLLLECRFKMCRFDTVNFHSSKGCFDLLSQGAVS